MKTSSIEWSYGIAHWKVQRRRAMLYPSELRGARYFVGVSLKSRLFSRRWLLAISEAVSHQGGELMLCLVDSPYLKSTLKEPKSFSLFEKLRSERLTSLDLVMDRKITNCSRVIWSDLEHQVDGRISSELRSAFERKGRVFNLLMAQTRKALGWSASNSDVLQSCEFLLQELPTLMWIYYSAYPGAIDLYPAANAQFLWELDELSLSSELPYATELAASSMPLTYGHISLQLNERSKNGSSA